MPKTSFYSGTGVEPIDITDLNQLKIDTEAARDAALVSEEAASASATGASESATQAALSEAAAAAYTASTAADASQASSSSNAAQTAQDAAEVAQAASEVAKADAEAAQLASELARDASQVARNNSQLYAANSLASADNSAASAAAAATSEANSASSEVAAAASASASETSRVASEVAQVASEAAQVASEAAQAASETARDASVVARAGSEAAQAASELASTNASTARTGAEAAQAAAEVAQAAAEASEAASLVSENNAAASATASATSATSSEASRVASETAQVASEAAQAGSQVAQVAAEAAQASSETAQAASEASAQASATSASQAASSASAAASSQAAAASSASSAASSATNAQASADAALSALDSFDDRYLGQKASAPTLDNDGNALVAGSLYFNTTLNEMNVYDGTQWLAAYASLSGALLSTNDLSDLNDTSLARTNLGVAIGSDVQAHSSILDGTTASYTTAEETKLAGIEAGATGDQTAAEILTAIKTVDGSGSGLDADLLDGNHASAFASASHNHSTSDITNLSADTTDHDANAIITSGFYHAIANVPTNDGESDKAIWHNQYGGSSIWSTQLATSWRNGRMWLRNKENGTWESWHEVWTTNNDGSGSGLDADLLDGYHASSFLLSNDYNYTRALNGPTGDFNSQTSYSYVSALDANANTPFGSAWYNLVNVRHRGGSGDGSSWGGQIAFGMTSYQDRIAFRTHSSGTWQSWNELWHKNNDGSGSGLDADLLDGVQGSSYLRSDQSDTMNGFLTIQTSSGNGSFGPSNTSWFHMNTDRPNFYMSKGLNANGDIKVYNANAKLSGNGVYGNVFYDAENTGYYCDPASTARINDVYANVVSIATSTNTSGYALDLGNSIHMHNNEINYLNQIHFNDNVRFYDDGNDRYLNYKWGYTGSGGIRFLDGGSVTHGYIYGDGSGRFGLLDNDGAWAVRIQTGTSPLELRCDNNVEFYVYNSYTYSPGSSRAPIFYDSNDTAYYCNPNSTSNFNALNVGGVAVGATTAGAVGTYTWLIRTTGGSTISAGTTYAGSGLRYSGVRVGYNQWYEAYSPGTVGNLVGGTWRAMGTTNNNSGIYPTNLFVRIS